MTIRWAAAVPVVALLALVLVWPTDPPSLVLVGVGVLLVAAVLAAVHHAEIIAHRVGEPFGSLILAVAVTMIEVGLVLTLMVSDPTGTTELARDTAFAAVMITTNAIVGASVIAGTLRGGLVSFNPEGTATALATVATLTVLTLVLPTFTTSTPGPDFSPAQLTFAAVVAVVLYTGFIIVQTVRHREFFSPVGQPDTDHPETPTNQQSLVSLGFLVVALISVVGLAKVVTPAIGAAIAAVGAPLSAVGVVIAMLVLLPETLAAVRNARRGRIQTSFNLAFGSAIASIGLTIPAIALASIWLEGPLTLGLGATQIVLFSLTIAVGALTVLPGRATLQEGFLHMVVFAAFLVLAMIP